jgi:LCP family protein required for cell wall assembly
MIMRHWTIGMLGCAAIGITISAWMIWNRQPDRHFVSKDYPVLAVPSLSKAELPNDGSSYSFRLKSEQRIRDDYTSSINNINPNDSRTFNILLLGMDDKGDEGTRTDVILLVHVIPAAKKAAVVSVPRDSRVKLAEIDENKSNHTYTVRQKDGSQGGNDAVIQAVSDLFQVPIHYYAKTDFKGFQQFIDEVGGVDLEIPQDIRISASHMYMSAGVHHLDGRQSLSFVKELYLLVNDESGRPLDQTLLLKAVIHKLVGPERSAELPKLIAKVKKDVVETNFSESDLINLALWFKG